MTECGISGAFMNPVPAFPIKQLKSSLLRNSESVSRTCPSEPPELFPFFCLAIRFPVADNVKFSHCIFKLSYIYIDLTILPVIVTHF